MISPIAVATEGYLNTTLAIATVGFLSTGDIPVEPPVYNGGGGSGAVSGESYFNQAPPQYKAPARDAYLEQALQEDEELLMLLSSLLRITQCH